MLLQMEDVMEQYNAGAGSMAQASVIPAEAAAPSLDVLADILSEAQVVERFFGEMERRKEEILERLM